MSFERLLNKLFKEISFSIRRVFCKENWKCPKKRNKHAKIIVLWQFFFTIKNQYFFKKKKTDTIKILITQALRKCHLISILMSSFSGSGVHVYVLQKVEMKMFPKKFFLYIRKFCMFSKKLECEKVIFNLYSFFLCLKLCFFLSVSCSRFVISNSQKWQTCYF